MLDEKDLQAIQSLIERSESRTMEQLAASESRMMEQLAASESRMMDRLTASESRMMERVAASESRMMERVAASESCMMERVATSESRMMAFIESDILPKFDILAEGHDLLRETLAPKSRVEELEEEIAFLKPLVMSMLTDIDKLKKAQ